MSTTASKNLNEANTLLAFNYTLSEASYKTPHTQLGYFQWPLSPTTSSQAVLPLSTPRHHFIFVLDAIQTKEALVCARLAIHGALSYGGDALDLFTLIVLERDRTRYAKPVVQSKDKTSFITHVDKTCHTLLDCKLTADVTALQYLDTLTPSLFSLSHHNTVIVLRENPTANQKKGDTASWQVWLRQHPDVAHQTHLQVAYWGVGSKQDAQHLVAESMAIGAQYEALSSMRAVADTVPQRIKQWVARASQYVGWTTLSVRAQDGCRIIRVIVPGIPHASAVVVEQKSLKYYLVHVPHFLAQITGRLVVQLSLRPLKQPKTNMPILSVWINVTQKLDAVSHYNMTRMYNTCVSKDNLLPALKTWLQEVREQTALLDTRLETLPTKDMTPLRFATWYATLQRLYVHKLYEYCYLKQQP